MTGAIAAKDVSSRNWKIMMMLMQSKFENAMKSKIMKSKTTYLYEKIKVYN